MSIELHWVNSDADLHDTWHWVRPGLETILQKNPGNWIPEDVYFAVRSRQAFLGLFEDTTDGEFVAFIVLTPVQGHDGPSVHVWCFFNRAGTQAVEDNWHLVTDWCLRQGARRITAESIRPGWARFGERLGFRKVQVKYQLDLD